MFLLLNYIANTNPLEQFQENLHDAAVGFREGRERKRKRQRAQEYLSKLSPQDQALLGGLEDPESVTENAIKLQLARDENARLYASQGATSDKNAFDAEMKQIEGLREVIGEDNYVQGVLDIAKKHGYAAPELQQNPLYKQPNQQDFWQKSYTEEEQPRYIYSGPTKADKELKTYTQKKTIDEGFEKNKEVRSLTDKKAFEGVQQANKVTNLTKTGEQARKTKGTPTYSDKIKEKENAPTTGVRPEFRKSVDDIRRQIFGARG